MCNHLGHTAMLAGGLWPVRTVTNSQVCEVIPVQQNPDVRGDPNPRHSHDIAPKTGDSACWFQTHIRKDSIWLADPAGATWKALDIHVLTPIISS